MQNLTKRTDYFSLVKCINLTITTNSCCLSNKS
nr:MAG TPA: hypothetical protein [Caudoviricetes sp.]